MLVGRKYKSMWKLLASAHFNSSFDIDGKTNSFLKKYGLENDIEIKEDKGEKTGKLKPEKSEELHRVSQLFIHDNKHIADREATVINGLQDEIKSKFTTQYTVPDELAVTVTIDQDDLGDTESQTVKVDLQIGNAEKEIEIDSFGGTANFNEIMGDAVGSYQWAAWLGDEASPFYDESFVEGYGRDWMSMAVEQFWHTRSESDYANEIDKGLKSLMSEYVIQYKHVVDLNERSSYRAHVEDPKGKTVYTISNENENDEGEKSDGELSIVQDGFMKSPSDMKGLTEYLIDLEIIPKNSEIIDEG